MGLKGDPLQRRQIWDQGIKDTRNPEFPVLFNAAKNNGS